MQAYLVNSFIHAMNETMPQMGYQSVKRGNVTVKYREITGKGVVFVVGLDNQVHGNVAFNFTEQTAKKIVGTMMMGMQVDTLDEMAQSALSEMINMATSSAVLFLSKQGVKATSTPPQVTLGMGPTAISSKFIAVEMNVDGEVMELAIGLE